MVCPHFASVSRALRRHLAVFALALSAAFFGRCARAAKPEPVPDWVREAATLHLSSFPSETNAVVLLDDTDLTVTSTGRASEHHRRVIKILRPQGREDAAVFLPYSSDNKLVGLHIWSIAPDGREYAMNDKEIGEVGFPGQANFYVDVRARTARAPGSDPGGVVAYEYDQALPPYLNEITWEIEDALPTVSERYTLELPSNFTYSSVWSHHAAVKPADLEGNKWRWELTDIPALDLHETTFVPSRQAPAGRMSLHYEGPGVSEVGNTWPAIGQWYSHLIADRVVIDPDLRLKAQELAGSSTDFYDRVEPIAEWIQTHIRYFVIERGIGGLQPHPAAEIFRNRFGDCKDKAALLSAMLAAVGVQSDLLMVDSHRGVIDPQAPSLFGNHMIAAIELPEGYSSPKLRSVVTAASGRKYLIFDPTWEKTPFGQLEHGLQGSYGILVEGDHSQLLELPVLAPELNRVQRSASFRLAGDGSLTGSVVEKRFGDAAEEQRYLYESRDQHAGLEFLDHVLSADLPQFSVADVKVDNLSALHSDLTTSYELSAGHFGRAAGSLLMLRPRVLGSEDLLRVLREDHPDRKLPVDLHETLQAEDQFTIALPEGYVADELPDPVHLDLGFASYQSATTVSGNVLHFHRTFTVRQITLPADRFADVQRLANAIAVDEQSTAVLKKL